ncbi:MAG: Fe-S-binding domain-containing protein, partial [Syntrophobacteraceae bacterium CG07_land_8_20_14_0_80_61_8]
STGALFLMVGMLYERRHTRLISEFGGLAKVMPMFFVCFLITTLSSIGLPGLNGFVGEFLVLAGSWQHNMYYTIFAASGVILAAIYMLWMFQRVMYGKINNPMNLDLKDLSAREFVVILPMIAFMFWIGIYSQP